MGMYMKFCKSRFSYSTIFFSLQTLSLDTVQSLTRCLMTVVLYGCETWSLTV